MADSLDAAIIRRASQNHRIVTHVELRRLGLGKHAIYYRLRTGRLHREFPGVYSVGTPAMSAWERSIAAVTACGKGSLLADLAALALWGWLQPWPHKLSVITPNDRRPRGIAVHRSQALTNEDRARRYGIPVTSPARTQLDCAVLLPAQTLTRVVNDALHTPQLSRRLLKEICAIHPKHPGAKLILPFYDTTDGPTRSDWQDDFPTWCIKHGMPRPTLEHKIGPHKVDACFIEERLIVELDSWQSHSGNDRFEADRERDAANLEVRYPTVRVTWKRRYDQSEREANRLRRILELRRIEVAAFDAYTGIQARR
ncbi:MAG: hypothetical protein ACYDHH_02795 [Solirubrobacteraceae bacterium]